MNVTATETKKTIVPAFTVKSLNFSQSTKATSFIDGVRNVGISKIKHD